MPEEGLGEGMGVDADRAATSSPQARCPHGVRLVCTVIVHVRVHGVYFVLMRTHVLVRIFKAHLWARHSIAAKDVILPLESHTHKDAHMLACVCFFRVMNTCMNAHAHTQRHARMRDTEVGHVCQSRARNA